MESVRLGVRKGAWSEEEDALLKKCIQQFGEGKWHQVPIKAGLNRCRKSCRLRWLNYLRPNIKRGKFTVDEVDLIIRLHKLLDNRWTLIAGRLPGRTANDIKNYWNTRLHKKTLIELPSQMVKPKTQTKIIRPRPRIFSKNLPSLLLWDKTDVMDDNIQPKDNRTEPFPPPLPGPDDGISRDDNDILVQSKINSGLSWSTDGLTDEDPIIGHWAEKMTLGGMQTSCGSFVPEDQSDWNLE